MVLTFQFSRKDVIVATQEIASFKRMELAVAQAKEQIMMEKHDEAQNGFSLHKHSEKHSEIIRQQIYNCVQSFCKHYKFFFKCPASDSK